MQGPWGADETWRIFRVNIAFTREGQKCQTGFHVRDSGVQGMTEEEVANVFHPWASTQFIKFLRTTDSLIGVDVENLVTREGFSHSFTNQPGQINDAPAPSFLTVPISIKGSIRRRYGNGRMLWPVPSQGFLNGNVLHPTFAAYYQAALTALSDIALGDGVSRDVVLVHAHGPLAALNARPAVPAMWYDATSLRLNTTIGSLSRRKIGHGV